MAELTPDMIEEGIQQVHQALGQLSEAAERLRRASSSEVSRKAATEEVQIANQGLMTTTENVYQQIRIAAIGG